MKRIKIITCLLIVFTLLIPAGITMPERVEAAKQIYHWKLYTDAKVLYEKGKYAQAIPLLQSAIQQEKNVASYYRLLAECYEKTGQNQLAADTYYAEAKVQYALAQKSGDYNTYYAVLNKADALNSELELYIQDTYPTVNEESLGKFEPAFGAYIGAFIERDKNLEPLKSQRYDSFNKMMNKQHAVFFNYHKYGDEFPKTLAENVKKVGGALQIALEPSSGLNSVKEDAYLIQFAKDAAESGVPIFLRYASEMNGYWVAWYGNPSLYIEKFRLVHDVMEKYAPNVAMVWSPAETPKQTINDYYPGDKYVDWVGLSMYSVKFFNGDASQPADHVNPLDSLDYLYEQYADRKPIMISEYAATHYSKAGNQGTTQFAITKMNMLYHGMKLKYPRVKAVHWFSLNTLEISHSVDRKLNNFSLTENVNVRDAYRKMINDPYFLSSVQTESNDLGTIDVYRYSNQVIRDQVTAIFWTKTYDPNIQKVVVTLDGQQIAELRQYPFQFSLNAKQLKTGTHQLKAIVYDSKGKVAISKVFNVKTSKGIEKLEKNQVKLFINDTFIYTPEGKTVLAVAPYTKNYTTMVPLRFVSTLLGAQVTWDNNTKTIGIIGDKNISLQVGQKQVKVNGVTQMLSVAPETINGTTFVPLRFVNEQLGGSVSFNNELQSIDIFAK